MTSFFGVSGFPFNKGYFGPAVVGSGLFQWSAQAAIGGGFLTILGLASNGAGTVLALTPGGIYKTTDGGVTFTLIAGSPTTGFSCMAYNGTVFMYGGGAGSIDFSSNNGATWTGVVTGALNTGGQAPIAMVVPAGNSGNWVALGSGPANQGGGNSNYATSGNNGASWTAANGVNALYNNGWFGPTGALWDGTQYVAVGSNANTFTATINTSANGQIWTENNTTVAFSPTILFDGTHYAIGRRAAAIRIATTPAGLITASDIAIPGVDASGVDTVFFDGQKYFAFDSKGGVASSTSLTSGWTPEQLNFATGDWPAAIVFDITHQKNIAGGFISGSISTRAK